MSLKIVCLLKQTLPTEAKISILDTGKPGDARSKPIINPYDEFGIEEAVKLKEAGKASEVTLLSVGTDKWLETIRRGLAMGADQAVLIDVGSEEIDQSQVAEALANQLQKMEYDLVLCGKLAVDTGLGEVPGRVAARLGIPLLHVAAKVDVEGNKVTVERVADGNIVHVEAECPVIVSADKSLNKPRFASLPNIMKAKKKPIDTVALADVLSGAAQTRRTVKYELPPERGPVRMLEGENDAAARKLVDVLVNEEKIVH